jgi:tetratricopeptide (TPR) repeat protein
MLEPDSQDASVWLEKGRLELQCLNLMGAREYLVQALILAPHAPDAWLQYGSVLEKLECYGEAIAANNNAKKLYANPLTRLVPPSLQPTPVIAAGIAAKQKSVDYWLQQGYALGDAGRYEDAIISFDNAIELSPAKQEAWFSRSNTLAALGRFPEAIASYEKAAELNPQDYQVWNNFGYVWHQMGNYEQAIAHYDKAIVCKPSCAPAWNNRGFALFYLGLYDTAIACYDDALALNPTYAAAWHNRGNALRALERYEEAIANFDRALAIQPDFQEVKNSRNLALQKMGGEATPPDSPTLENTHESPPESADFEPQEKAIVESNPVPQIAAKPVSGLVQLQETTAQLLQNLQNPNLLPTSQAILKRQLAESNQHQVDLLARQNPSQALELAEEFKDRCFGSLRDGWNYQPVRLSYAQIQTLLSPRTAVIYWHISPKTLTTFILKQNQPPQVLQSPAPPLGAETIPGSAVPNSDQRQELETWLADWNKDYLNYRSLDPLPTAGSPWREHMELMLFSRLRSILETQRICLEHLQDIDQLILIPHRELHLLPLSTLFPERYTITYLPSARFGLAPAPTARSQRLLSIEEPTTHRVRSKEGRSNTLFAQLESALVTQLYGSFRTQSVAKDAATKPRVIAALNLMSGCFYFNGYSHTQPEAPHQPSLALTEQDLLTCQDLFALNLHNYFLVCLSIDEAEVLNAPIITDEAVDLVRGFLSTGVAHVLSTIWKVNGISSVLMMTEFHRKLLLERLPPAQALAQTQRWLRNVTYSELSQWYQSRAEELDAIDTQNLLVARLQDFAKIAQEEASKADQALHSPPPYVHPYYWAGFKVTGNAF